MKKHILTLALLISAAPLFGMEAGGGADTSVVATYQPAPRQPYPATMGFVPEQELLALCKPLPAEVQERVNALLERHPNILKLCSLQQQHAAVLAHEKIAGLPARLSDHNHVFYTSDDHKEVVKIAGFHNSLKSAISHSGYDPWGKNLPDGIELSAVASKTPRFQHLSTLTTMKLLERARSETVVPVETWAYHLPGHPKEACDQNYIVVQKRLPKEYAQLSTLDDREKQDVLQKIDLEGLHRVLQYANLWNPSEDNLWVNKAKQSEFAYPDGEKPNNEGAGVKAKWKIALFGQALEKAEHNIKVGHEVFENILKALCPDRVAEWMAYYDSDTEVK